MILRILFKPFLGIFSLVFVFLVPAMGWGQTTTVTFSGTASSTTGAWIVPCGVTSFTVTVIGGGGGGGSNSNGAINGSGGGGGGYSTASFTSTPGTSFNYQAGAYGAGSSGSGNGSIGTISWFQTSAVLFGNPGAGGTTSGTPGGNGGTFGGTAPGMTGSNGNIGSNGTGTSGGAGGNNGLGTGGAATNSTANTAGADGNTGGGGAGGYSTGGARDNGGRGGGGRVIITYTGPNAGPDQSTLCGTSATLAANTPAGGATGTWTCISGCTGVTFSPNATTPNATVNGLTVGTNTTLQWTWTGGGAGCAVTNDQVVISTQGPGCWVYCSSAPNSSVGDYISNVTFGAINNTTAGSSYTTYSSPCAVVNTGTTYPLCVTVFCAGTEHVTAVFDWNNDGDFADTGESFYLGTTSVDGTVLCANITIPAGATIGNTTMRIIESWNAAAVSPFCTVTNTYGEIENYCVTIAGCLMNTPNAGPDQNLAACANSATLAGNTITNGTGFWSLSSGVGTITTPSSPTSTVTNLGVGANTFYWTATPTDGNCPTLNDDVVITTNGLPTAPNAGPDAATCNASYTLAGNTITVGTGAWSCTANCGGITFGAPTSPTSTVNGLVIGTPVTVRWTSTNGACVSTDDVMITRVAGVSAANAGADQAVCINTTATLAGNTPAIGTGTWTSTYGFISNPTLPNTEVTGLAATGVYTFTYTVSAAGCASSVDQMLLTVNQCDPTMNVVTCGTPMTFTDGAGNYPDNANIVKKYCPSVPGQYITATFSQMTMASSLDNMIVLNGAFSTAPIIDDFYSLPTINGGANTITSSASDGCLTFVFVSNASSNAAGWTASISCTPTASTTNVTTCNHTDCLGGCMRTICGVPTQVPFSGGSIGVSEVNDNNNGCWAPTAGEKCSNWFYINPTSSGTLAVGIYVNNGLDQDFLVWDGYAPVLSCPAVTGNDPLRCNFAAASSEGTGFDDVYDAAYSSYESSIVISQAQIDAGYYLIMLVVSYGNSCPQATVDISFGGTAQVGCNPPISALGVTILNFDGAHANGKNYIHWDVEREDNLAYYTLERSSNGNDWTGLGSVFAGQSDDLNYSLVDETPYLPFTYYRLNIVDTDGSSEYSNIISLSAGNLDDNWVSNLLPNPASDNFSFQYQGKNFNEPVVVNMYNSIGQLVYTQSEDINNKSGITINSSLLENGAYIVMITQGDKKMMKKLTIIR